MKVECPSLEHVAESANGGFFLLLDLFFYCNIILNPYVIYCIIFCSTRYMNTYRWYLLYHQIIGLISDISISCLTKPVFLLPFPAAYLTGFLRGWVHPRYMLVWCIGFITFNMATIGHLFTYRYVTAKGFKIFPLRYKFCMIAYVFVAAVPTVGAQLAYKNENDVFKEWSKTYSCITPAIIATPNIMAYDQQLIYYFLCLPILGAIVFYLGGMAFFITQTYRAIRLEVMSTRLKQMQRLYLLQVMLQAFIPLLLVILPAIPFIVIVMFDIYGFSFMSPLLMSTLSSFSLVGAVILILMNPTYRTWRRKSPAADRSTFVVSVIERS